MFKNLYENIYFSILKIFNTIFIKFVIFRRTYQKCDSRFKSKLLNSKIIIYVNFEEIFIQLFI